jgi:3-hydroxybutyryl-CoA dehydratase
MSYEIGTSASRTKTFTHEDVAGFAQISTDTNPIHLDDAYAQESIFGQRVVHGMLTASLISAVLANDFPGPGTIYLGQNLKFTKPVFIGDTITATVIVTKFREDKGILSVDTVCTNQHGETVISGDAVVKVP